MRTIETALLVSTLAVSGMLAGQVKVATTPMSSSFIGVGIQEIDSERAKTLKLREEAGVEITRVDPDSPAEKAGLKTGDVVLQYNGQRVEGIEQFSRMVHETPAGREVKLEIWRNGASQSVTVKVGARRMPKPFPGEGFSLAPMPPMERFDVRIPDVPRSYMSRSEEHTSELQSRLHLVCRLLLEKQKKKRITARHLRRVGWAGSRVGAMLSI